MAYTTLGDLQPRRRLPQPQDPTAGIMDLLMERQRQQDQGAPGAPGGIPTYGGVRADMPPSLNAPPPRQVASNGDALPPVQPVSQVLTNYNDPMALPRRPIPEGFELDIEAPQAIPAGMRTRDFPRPERGNLLPAGTLQGPLPNQAEAAQAADARAMAAARLAQGAAPEGGRLVGPASMLLNQQPSMNDLLNLGGRGLTAILDQLPPNARIQILKMLGVQ